MQLIITSYAYGTLRILTKSNPSSGQLLRDVTKVMSSFFSTNFHIILYVKKQLLPFLIPITTVILMGFIPILFILASLLGYEI